MPYILLPDILWIKQYMHELYVWLINNENNALILALIKDKKTNN